MARTVTVRVRFAADRSMRVVVPGPAGPVDVGSARQTAELGRIAAEGVRSVWGPEPVDFDIRVDRPAWLLEAMIVRLDPASFDPSEGSGQPYGQITGFLPTGGVSVTRPGAGSGVYPPEALTPTGRAHLPPRVLDEIVRYTGIDPVEP